MTPADAMACLDALVAAEPEDHRYRTARILYHAALAGLLAVPLPLTLLYGWVLKWATLPEARGRREPVSRPTHGRHARKGAAA